ncbi:MAG: VIT domain-containing protein [Planctomycetota bacterium]|jgi:Ca-activated chloride channel family protein
MPLEVKKHHVDVSMVDGVAVTGVDQVFFNPYNRIVEGTYIFPLEDDVALSKFSMFVNGQEIEGKLLSVEEARRTYESIVARMRDPALLEYIGRRMFQARIFPINPKSEVRVRLSYTQMLATDAGLVYYRYPLDTEKHLASSVESVSVLVNLESSVPIKDVFSPSHRIAVSRSSDYRAGASYEGRHVYPDKDFELYYVLSDKEFGMTILTHRRAGEDGFFLARIAPPAKTTAQDVMPKDIAFVIDTSGSMSGDKMHQAIEALKFCLANLNPGDRFNVVPFSHEALRFRGTLVDASPVNVEEARKFADGLKATGGTNINDALLTALTAAPDSSLDRPYLIVFLTDGQPTIGVTIPDEILSNVRAKNAERVRLFVFGVGDDVNTMLLDLLAEQNRGTRDYVRPGEDLELKLSSFYRKVCSPVLADLSLSFGGLRVYDLYPPKLGDLFAGSELVVVGRYSGVGARAVELNGSRRGQRQRFIYETTFPSEKQTHEFLPRLWATRKVGYLLDEMRLHGENRELKDTVVELATRYGIVTPYTAYLVTEPGGVAFRQGGRGNVMADAVATRRQLRRSTGKKVRMPPGGGGWGAAGGGSGAPAVEESMEANALRMADSETVRRLIADTGEAEGDGHGRREGSAVAHVGTRTFYRIGESWIDAAYDKTAETSKIELFSEAYFELLRKHPELAKCFALGERVIVVLDSVAYETVPPPAG